MVRVLHFMSMDKFKSYSLWVWTDVWVWINDMSQLLVSVENLRSWNPLCSVYSSLPQLLATTDQLTVSIVLLFPECHAIGITQCIAFSDWILSPINIHLQFFHGLIVHFFSAKYYPIIWMYHSLLIHTPVVGHLGHLWVLSVMKKATIEYSMQA